jgi:hypothetical protein
MRVKLCLLYLQLIKNSSKLFFVLLVTVNWSCNKTDEKLGSFLLEKFPLFANGTVIVIPGGGCTGCITSIERQVDSLAKVDTIRIVYTKVSSFKILNSQLREKGVLNHPNIYVDSVNKYEEVAESYSDIWSFPTFIRLKDGRIKSVRKYSIY